MRTIEILYALCVLLSFEDTGLDDDILLVVDHLIELFGRQSEQVTDLVWQRAEVPDMSNRNNELDMSSTLTTYLFLRNLNTTTVADDTFVTDALVLTAGALIVFRRTEDSLTEQAVALWLVGAVVDGLGLGHLTIGVLLDCLRRGQANGNLGKIILYLCIFFESHTSNFSIFQT